MPKQFKSWWDFNDFSRSVRSSARFIHDRSVLTFLNTLLQTSASRHRKLTGGKFVWRAQLGFATEECTQDDFVWEEPIPYPRERMKPLALSAHEGRVNSRGIPCLYVATSKETAMAEVRPWLDSTLSVGQFRLARDLTLIDFSVGHASTFEYYMDEPAPEEREKSIWATVDRAFSEPVTSTPSTAEYVPTQVIAEFFKVKKFDGVVYKSNFGSGFNIALFDLAAAELVNCSLCNVKAVDFSLSLINM